LRGETLIENLRLQLREAEDKLRKLNEKITRLNLVGNRLDTLDAKRAELAEIDRAGLATGTTPEALRDLCIKMNNAQAVTSARRLQDAHDAASERAIKARQYADYFDKLVALFRDELPKRLVARMTMPAEGLAVESETIKIHGVPLHQLGTSEQIRVGVAIAAALNPQTGFILVDGAESMGRGDRLALAEAAKEQGLQLIMSFVDPDAEPKDGVVVMSHGERVIR
jgi:hypothetical protein